MGLFDGVRQLASDINTIARGYGGTPPGPAPGQIAGSSSGKLSAYPLIESVSVVLDGSGNGTARITPGQPAHGGGVGAGRNSGLSWDISGTYVSVSTNTAEASAVTYISYGIQSTSPTDGVGQTEQGSTGDTGSFTGRLVPGDWITTIWTGGDAGSIATMRVTGTVTPPGAG
jgi:hypothetical protein